MKIKNYMYKNSPKRKRPCRNKKVHESYKDAVEHKDRLITKTVLQFGIVNVFYCHAHEGWHVGHRRWEGKEPWQKLPKNMVLRKTVSL